MSYSFDGVGDTLTGTLAATYPSVPITLACFIKIATHPLAPDAILEFGNSSSSIDDSQFLQTDTVLDTFSAISRTTTTVTAKVIKNIDGVWVGYVGVFTNNSLRDVYLGTLAATGTNVLSRAVANAMQFVRLGQNLAGANDFTGKMAEVAIWNSALSLSDIDIYLRQFRRASAISPATLIGYWPLSTSNASQANKGLDAGGTLSVANAVFDADHPPLNDAAPRWEPFDFAARRRSLRQGALNVGNTQQNLANLRTLALAQIASPSNPPWAKLSGAVNMPKKILIYPSRVPGYRAPGT